MQEYFQAKATNLLPAKNDPPLNLKVPKPSFANAKSRSAFGFQVAAIPEMDHAQDDEHQENMEVDMEGSADKMDDGDDIDMYVSEGGGHNLGMIHPLSFNTLTFFART